MPLLVLVDAVIILLGATALSIDLTGGGEFFVRSFHITAKAPDNALLALALLLVVRYCFRSLAPFLGRPSWRLDTLPSQATTLLADVDAWCRSLHFRDGARTVLLGAAAATALKAVLAWTNPGFFSGDDVEVHQMSLRALYHTTWPIWDLRNPTFPLAVIYPAQRVAALLGMQQTQTLIWSGRLVVAVLSSVGIWLLWIAGTRLWKEPGWAVIGCLLFASNRLHIAFGSSELPRPVSTVAVVTGYLLAQQRGLFRNVGAGVMIGIAASLRFSEVIFLVPAALQLALERRARDAFVLVVAGVASAAAILAVTDYWYWGEPFHSLRAALDYTVVRGLSSRGYQPLWWYLTHAAEWANPALLACAIAGGVLVFRQRWPEVLWAAVPVIVLSALPHKEARYLIPVIPFVCLLAAAGIRELSASGFRLLSRRREWGAPALAAALGMGVVFDAGHWRLPRTNDDVALARRIAATAPHRLIIEQAWRVGGPLYLEAHDVQDIDPAALSAPHYVLSILPPGGWALLDGRRNSYAASAADLSTNGYQECRPDGRSSYRLWIPRGVSGCR